MTHEPPPEHVDDLSAREHAAALIPGGASTGSKRVEALYGEDSDLGPSHFLSAAGCTIVTAEGDELIDCTMALGAVALGYADSLVTDAVIQSARSGNVSGLSSTLEILVADRLCGVIPCAERVRFLKTGAEAVAAAVRIARVATGRTSVIGCGYFGWLDWAREGAGIPARRQGEFVSVPFDDVPALEAAAAAAGADLAAIVIEPVIERLPSDDWVRSAREICDRGSAVLVFDELKTGFRLRPGGYQELSGITPDLATFGKAMANGYPLAAVVGRAEVMEAATRTWISSTLASEGTALAAANAVLDWHEKVEVCEGLSSIGEEMMSVVSRAITASGIEGFEVDGLAQMWLMRVADARHESRFVELAVREGVLFKRGAYNFAALAHDDDAIVQIERAASSALVALQEEMAEDAR